jgi:hypothetical protein
MAKKNIKKTFLCDFLLFSSKREDKVRRREMHFFGGNNGELTQDVLLL